MHAVVVRVTINDPDAAEAYLRDQVVPSVSAAPGFVSGNWTGLDNTGMSMIIFESEEAARGMADRVASDLADNPVVTLDGVEVREVVASA